MQRGAEAASAALSEAPAAQRQPDTAASIPTVSSTALIVPTGDFYSGLDERVRLVVEPAFSLIGQQLKHEAPEDPLGFIITAMNQIKGLDSQAGCGKQLQATPQQLIRTRRKTVGQVLWQKPKNLREEATILRKDGWQGLLKSKGIFERIARPNKHEVAQTRVVLAALKERGLLETDPRIKTAIKLLRSTDEIHFRQFHNMLRIGIIERAFSGLLVIPDFPAFCADIRTMKTETEEFTGGANATYIYQLSENIVDPRQYGVGVCTVDGQQFSCGDTTKMYCAGWPRKQGADHALFWSSHISHTKWRHPSTPGFACSRVPSPSPTAWGSNTLARPKCTHTWDASPAAVTSTSAC